MGRSATWSLLLGLVGSGCAFDASGVPTASDDGTGVASSEGSGDATSTSTTATATTMSSASGDTRADTSTTDDVSSTDPATTTNESDPSTSSSTDPGSSTSTGDASSSGGPDPICGNGMIESPETCETGDLGGFVCSNLGDGYGGEPTCAGCQIDDGPCCIGSGTACVPAFNDCCDGCGLDFVCD